MKTAKTIKSVQSIQYHRNGVGGAGFYLIEFSGKARDEKHLLATVFPCGDEDYTSDGYIAVVNLNALTQRYRGNDYYGDDLLAVIKKHVKQQRAADKRLGR